MRHPRIPKGASHIVNHMAFTDARPTISSPSATFDPGKGQGVMPNGPSRYPPGETRTQKNVKRNLDNPNSPY